MKTKKRAIAQTSKDLYWPDVVATFYKGKTKTRRVLMGSPGSAQVTATRLRKTYGPLGLIEIKSEGDRVVLTK